MLQGKTVLLAVTGSIAAYKAAQIASACVKLHAKVRVLMTQNATKFIGPVTFETLTGNKCLVDTFDRNFTYSVEHVALAKEADVVLVAPATANVIGKLAGGIADDMLTTTVMACTCPKIIAPAMNTAMWENSIVQENIEKLKRHGFIVAKPESGRLACGDVGEGKLPSEETLLSYLRREIAHKKDYAGKKVLVTAGPTAEPMDPVRVLTNHSTGKMGYAIAKAAMERGADVTLVSGPTFLEAPMFVHTVAVQSAQEMFAAVTEIAATQDVIIKAAAVADYTPVSVAKEKIKKTEKEMTVTLKRTQDILGYLGEHKSKGQILCGFSMETENLIENSREKLEKKHLDLIAANNINTEGAGFGTDTNVVTLITKNGQKKLPKMSKDEVAREILDQLLLI